MSARPHKVSRETKATFHTFNSNFSPASQSMQLLTITPEIAIEMLLRNARNRPINKRQVKFFCTQMLNNLWHLHGNPIQFNTKDELCDGQHRLSALIDADMSLQFWVLHGVSSEAVAVIDTGKPRNVGDYLTMKGIPNASTVGSMIRMFHAYHEDQRDLVMDMDKRLNHEQVLNMYLELPNFDKSSDVGRSLNFMAAGSVMGFCHYVIACVDEEGADEFFEMVMTGADLPKNHPALFLRERLLRQRSLTIKRKNNRGWVADGVFKSWNAFAQGRKELRYIKWLDSSDFPKILSRQW